MDVLTFKTCRAVNSEIRKQVTSSWSISIQKFLILIKIQLDAAVRSLIYFTAKSLYMFRVSTAPIIRNTIKSVTAATGTSLQRGQVGTLERSICTDIMTCTGGCSYSL